VDDISFSVNKGEIVGFLGPNGAGKSTVMKIVTNYLKEFEGEVFINDISVRENPIATQKLIGYLPEHNPLYLEMYVREYLSFHAELYQVSKEKIEEIITEVGLTSHAHKRIQELSKGFRQRVGLAAALLHNPEVLILDEPTTGLDPNQLTEIRNLIKEVGKNKTVLFSTHIMQEVEAICDRVIVIHKGKIVANESLEKLQQQTEQIIEVEFDMKIEKQFFNKISNLTLAQNIFDTTWEIHFSAKEDMRPVVFDFAQAHGLKILNLSRKNKSLEQLFKELTKD
jgi:ABC-2 type transport system ATP-binding protein